MCTLHRCEYQSTGMKFTRNLNKGQESTARQIKEHDPSHLQ